MTSHFQSRVSSLTPSTICSGVNLGPEANFLGSVWPLARIFMLCPPTSITSTFTSVCEFSVTQNKYYTTETRITQTADRDREWTRISANKGFNRRFTQVDAFHFSPVTFHVLLLPALGFSSLN